MAIEADSKDELIEIQKKIRTARIWALKYFRNADVRDNRFVDENLEMLPPRFFVLFPAPDRMKVSPSIMGKPSGLWIHYRLHFHKSGLAWVGRHPFYGYEYPSLIVEAVEGTDIPVPCNDTEMSRRDAIELAAAALLMMNRK